MWFIIVLAVIVFLVMEHPIAFWLVFVPLGLLFILSIIGLFNSKRAGLSNVVTPSMLLIVIIIALVLIV